MAEFIDIHIKHGDEVYFKDDHGNKPIAIGQVILDEHDMLVIRIQHDDIERL